MTTVTKMKHPRVPIRVRGNFHVLCGHQLPRARGFLEANVRGFLEVVVSVAGKIQSFHCHSTVCFIKRVVRPSAWHLVISGGALVVLVPAPIARVVTEMVLRELGN